MKVEAIKCLSHSVELNFGEISVCITTADAENLIAQLRAVVPVPAEEIEGTPQEVTLIPSNDDEDEAAEMAARRAYPYEGGTKGDICEASIPIFCKGFKAGIAYERERLMKDAMEGEIQEREQIIDLGNGFAVKLGPSLAMKTMFQVKGGDKVSVIIIKKEK